MAEKGSTLKISQLSLKTSLSVLDNLQENVRTILFFPAQKCFLAGSFQALFRHCVLL